MQTTPAVQPQLTAQFASKGDIDEDEWAARKTPSIPDVWKKRQAHRRSVSQNPLSPQLEFAENVSITD
jgi:hypothetical protein